MSTVDLKIAGGRVYRRGKLIRMDIAVDDGMIVKLGKEAAMPRSDTVLKADGCIGFPYPVYPLVEATIKAAIESAVGDPRFPPVDIDEVNYIVFEVSLLTPPEEVKVDNPRRLPSMIEIGRDGLIVQRGIYSGLLLPQVPVEQGWDQEEFLSYCCLKAGLPPDAWLLKNTRIYRFRAEIFEEEYPRGPIHRRSLR